MADEQVPRKEKELKDDPKLISPPVLAEPAYQCAKKVKVSQFIPLSQIEITINAVLVASSPVGFPSPNGALINIPSALVAGQKIRARQTVAGITSGWSNEVTVRDHLVDYPAGLPRPVIDPAPVYECGSRTGVNNLVVGANVWITADGVETGRVNGCNDHQGVNVAPEYANNQFVIARAELCSDKSPESAIEKTRGYAYPLPAPAFDTVYQGSQQIRITNIANGARVTLKLNGINQGTSGCWGGSLNWNLSSPLPAGATLEATQKLCGNQPPSPPGTTVSLPCGNLPAPTAYPVQIGDVEVRLSSFVWGALVKVYINNVKVGEGSGSVIPLTQAVSWNDTLLIGQELGTCKSQYLTVIRPLCIAPPIQANPSDLNLFPVGTMEYSRGDAKGSVFYPGESDGDSVKFNKRLALLKRSPIVFLAHGNHVDTDPSYLGYDYFQKQLAQMGFIAVSVDCNKVNYPNSGGGVANIEARVDLIIESIKLFQSFDSAASNIFSGKIDFSLTGLMGHSRGGDAVVMTPELISLSGVTIVSVLALAPTDFRGSITGTDVNPKGFDFMTILPAGDGDVWQNNGARFYDRCSARRFKSQLYVHFTNHNFFNREWLFDEGLGPVRMQRFEHEEILSAYGCAFFRRSLMGHNTLSYITGHALPSGVRTDAVHLSCKKFKQLTVDDHEQTGGIAINTMGQATSQTGMAASEFPFKQGAAGSFDNSFFGNTTGMVIQYEKHNATFISPLKGLRDLKGKEIWIRVAEVFGGSQHVDTGFQLGLTDSSGFTAWVDSSGVGGIPDPYPHPGSHKTMLKTLRFRATCFQQSNRRFRISEIAAIRIRCNRTKPHPALAFDDLQIVS